LCRKGSCCDDVRSFNLSRIQAATATRHPCTGHHVSEIGTPASTTGWRLTRHGFSSTGSQWSSRRGGVQDGFVVYTHTFIAVAEDCRAATGEVPRERAGGPTVASTQYAMLAAAPGQWTQEDVQLASSPEVRGRDIDEAELRGLRQEYFSQPRACLRASSLPESFGWGLHYEAYGRITLHAVDSPEYAQLSSDASLTQLQAMRSSRPAG